MALRKILGQNDATLRAVCKPVEFFDDKLARLLDDMVQTLTKADGLGLAAPQIGIRRRVCVINADEDEIIELINPVVLKKSGSQRDVEGCLSCPDLWGYVVRPSRCRIKYQNRSGDVIERTFRELAARCALHEIDHLNGVLFTEFVDEYVDPEEVKRESRKAARKNAKKDSKDYKKGAKNVR